jgi:nitrogen fixation-related uncharacterized protein
MTMLAIAYVAVATIMFVWSVSRDFGDDTT